jgi:hypothetical protein
MKQINNISKKEVLIMANTQDKVTYVSAVDFALNYFEGKEDVPADIVEKMGALKESLEKRANAKRSNKKVEENDALRDALLSALGTKGVRVADIMKMDGFTEFSSQKISALLSPMVKDGRVVKTIDKKVAYFSLPTEVEVEVAVEVEE